MKLFVSPEKLVFDNTRTQTFSIIIEIRPIKWSGFTFKASHNLPSCFKVDGFQEVMKTPSTVTVRHTPCHNDCFSDWLFLEFGGTRVLVEKLETQLVDKTIDVMTSLECKICIRQFDEEELIPRILTSCGHTVCEDCAKRLLRGFDIVCPFDRKITTVTNTGISYLQKNFTLLEVLQERQTHQMPESSSKKHEEKEKGVEIPCFENPSHEAIYYCEQCEAEFCKKCFKQVHTPRIFSRHRKVPVLEKPIKLPKCVQHPYNTAEFVCKDPHCQNENDLMCHTCILSSGHKGHHYNLLMDELMENEIALKNLLENLDQSTRKLKSKVSKTQECAQSFDTSGQTFHGILNRISREFEAKKAQALEDLTDFAVCLKRLAEQKKENLEEVVENARILRKEVMAKLKMKTDFRNVKEILDNGRAICNAVDEGEDEDQLRLHEYTFRLSDKMTLTIDSS